MNICAMIPDYRMLAHISCTVTTRELGTCAPAVVLESSNFGFLPLQISPFRVKLTYASDIKEAGKGITI